MIGLDMTDKNSVDELSESEGIRRLKNKAKEMKHRQVVPPVDSDEPSGLLSGGPDSLDLEDVDESNKT